MSTRKAYVLKLYVAGNTPNSLRALSTLQDILEKEFRGVYSLKVIDVLKNPQLAEEDIFPILNLTGIRAHRPEEKSGRKT